LKVFNDGDTLIDIGNWKITGIFADGLRAELPVSSLVEGKLASHKHAVVQISEEVGDASFDTLMWLPVPTRGAVLTSLEVSVRVDGWKTDTYALKTSGSSSAPKYDDFWVRNQISGESYTSTLSSFTVQPVELHDDGLYIVPDTFPGNIVEIYSYASNCTPSDVSILCGDYIKLHVDKNADLDSLSSFVVRTDSNSASRTTSNTFHINDAMVNDDGYLTVWLDDSDKRVSLTNSGGYVWLEDLYGLKRYDDTMTQYASASSDEQGYSWAHSDDGLWQWSTTPQPFSTNVITVPVEEVTTCPTGKYLNPDTGRCRTIEEAVNALSACPEGQYRNPSTNRCRQIVSTASTLVPCGEGQERNPLTNRCRSIASAVAELLPCDEGYERNPATNRCRKVAGVSTAASSQNQLIEPEKDGGINVWTWSLITVVMAGAVGYGVYEWRHELLGAGQVIAAKFSKK